MRVGYGKIGRVLEVNPEKWGESGGDNEPSTLLFTLAKRNPNVTWVVVGRNSGWKPPLPNIENPWQQWLKEVKFKTGAKPDMFDLIRRLDAVTMSTIASLDGQVMWLGQHGTSNSPLPKIEDRSVLTSPHMSFVHYSSFLLRGINAWRAKEPLKKEEVWLAPDPRNYMKAKDLKWPRRHPILGQFDWRRQEWCERYDDPRSPEECGFEAEFINGKWRAYDNYVGSGLELVGLGDHSPDNLPGFDERPHDFGILINENRNYGMRPEMTRLHIMQHYVKPLHPSWVHGTWSKTSNDQLGLRIAPLEYEKIFPLMRQTKTTFTTPASGSRWATAKPWECFSAGVICFFHPEYDVQGHIIPTREQSAAGESEVAHLASWLRVKSPEELEKKIKAVSSSPETYTWLAQAQLNLLRKEMEAQRCVTAIEKRLGL